MKKSDQFFLDANKIFDLPGLLHIFTHDLDGRILRFNDLQLEVCKEILGKNLKDKDIYGLRIDEIFNNGKQMSGVIQEENELIISRQTPQQFYNVWYVKDNFELKVLTTKHPIFNSENKVIGVLGISQYISKFSYSKAINQGLSKREVECVFHLFNGKTARETADLLCLSVRTIEDHIATAKEKLACTTKFELMQKLLNWELAVKTPPLSHSMFENIRPCTIKSSKNQSKDSMYLHSISDCL